MDISNESDTINIHVRGGTGGDGGRGRSKGGNGGVGEGPNFTQTVNTVGTLTNHITMHGQGLNEVLHTWLGVPPKTDDRQHELQSLRHNATGHWLLCDQRFVNWKDSPGTLWIKGISGTGKSVL
ncbi:hypothetical protein C8R47DRAFT_1141377, partial [Mycena vitilis]